MKSPSQTLQQMVEEHLKDLNISVTTKKMVAENLTKAIMDWINERRDAKLTHSPNATVMTPEAARSVDRKLGGGTGQTPPASL